MILKEEKRTEHRKSIQDETTHNKPLNTIDQAYQCLGNAGWYGRSPFKSPQENDPNN